MYKRVKQFNEEVLGIQEPEQNTLDEKTAEISFIALHEEADEFGHAAVDENMVEMVDAIIDGLYFGYGILHKMGISESKVERIFEVVHLANMSKTFGTNAKRDTGAADAVKPEDWVSPEDQIKEILEESEVQH